MNGNVEAQRADATSLTEQAMRFVVDKKVLRHDFLQVLQCYGFPFPNAIPEIHHVTSTTIRRMRNGPLTKSSSNQPTEHIYIYICIIYLYIIYKQVQ